MAKEPPVVSASGLTRAFGVEEETTVALQDVSLDLYRGQVTLVMGPSGSGKSTLLAVLSGLLRPNSGQVTALGKDLWCISEAEREAFRLRHCGFIFQGYNLIPALNAYEQLELVLRWGLGTASWETHCRVTEMLAFLDLSAKAPLLPGHLSGGEKQRVAVGRALIKSPELCFADEPTSALDWEHGKQVIELLRKAADTRGAMVVIVSHDARIIPYAHRVLLLEDGQLA
ncbi:MAG TPA: ABC transporter ATP-binding protein [Gemmataceae bacterium]|jgi:putative ABC transport system ATP-binding protein